MSVLSNIHTEIVNGVKLALPSYFHITNPYNIENNAGSFLNMGFAVAYGNATNDERLLSCSSFFEQRSITIFLIRLATHTDNNLNCRIDLENEILDDVFKIKKTFIKDCSLNNTVSEIKYIGDTGINYITAENEASSFDKYYSIELEFLIKYKEIL